MIKASGTRFNRESALLSNQSGQAVIEYVLLMIIVVTITLGFLYQLNTAFRSFAKNYFANYVVCLLEAGELPTLGSGGGVCASNYKPFKIGEGRPLVNPGGSGAGGGSGGIGGDGRGGRDGNGSGNGDSDRERNLRDRKIAETGNGDRGTGEGASGSSRVAAGNAGRFRGSSGDLGPLVVTQVNSKKGNLVPAGASGSGSGDTRGPRGYRSANSSATGSQTDRSDEQLGRLRFIPPTKEDGVIAKKADVIAVDPAEAKKRKGSRVPGSTSSGADGRVSDDEGFTLDLPNFIRYLLIAAIAIVILLLVGGQAMSIQKGTEKS